MLNNLNKTQDQKDNAFFTQSWEDFAQNRFFDHNTGFMFQPNFKPKSFTYETLETVINMNANKTSSDDYLRAIQTIQKVDATKISCYKQLILLKDSLSYIVNKLLIICKKENKSENDIKIPQNISRPVYQASTILQTKIGLAAGLSHNWKIIYDKNNPEKNTYNLDTIDLKWYFTQNKQQQKIFYGTSIISSFYMAKVIQSSYQINKIIQQNCQNKNKKINQELENIVTQFQHIALSCKEMVKKFDGQYFYNELRPFFGGFKNLYFQGIDQHLSSSGASAGQDPTYIMFEKAFGIFYDNSLKTVQQHLKLGMFGKHKQIQNYFEDHSQIRKVCSQDQGLKQNYNKVIDSYSKFNQIHSCLISKFILSNVSQQQHEHAKGTGDNKISDLINRWRKVQQFKLK